MDVALVLARALLAAVFGSAGVAMLADLSGTMRAMTGIGLPRRLAVASALALPAVALAVAVAVIVRDWAWWGALGALGLLLAFAAMIVSNPAQKRRPKLRIPGYLRPAAGGWSSLARTSALAAVAAFILWQGRDDPGPGMASWIGTLSGWEGIALGVGLLALALAAAVAWLAARLLRQNGRLLRRIEALEAALRQQRHGAVTVTSRTSAPRPRLRIGDHAPGFSLPGMEGGVTSLERLRADGRLVVLVFIDPGSDACRALLPEIVQWHRDHARFLTFALISQGAREANATIGNQYGMPRVLLQRGHEVADAYQVVAMPSAVLVRPDGTIGSSIAAGPAAIRTLMRRVTEKVVSMRQEVPARDGPSPTREQLRIGRPAPDVALSTIAGERVSLRQFTGEPTLVLFWNPECRFSRQMLDDLRAWQADAPPGSPRLLLITTGAVESTKLMDLRAPVLLDPEFVAGGAFGAAGTPTAVLIDAEGRIASEVAVGATAILALAGESAGHGQPARLRA